jgi:hypothetical protein
MNNSGQRGKKVKTRYCRHAALRTAITPTESKYVVMYTVLYCYDNPHVTGMVMKCGNHKVNLQAYRIKI